MILPTDAFCQVLPDGSDLASGVLMKIWGTLNNQRAVDEASAFVQEHHSWRRRAEQVFAHLANGAAIEVPMMQKERQGRARQPSWFAADLPHELKTTQRFG